VDTVEFLGRTALFSGLSRDDLRSVVGTAKERSFDPGATIIRRGHEGGRGFYMLLSGAAEVRAGDTTLATFGPGDYFGEMAVLLDETPRTADVVAIEPTTCLVVTQWDLKALITNHPEIGVQMMGELARRLRDTDRALED
jgi:CRP-like cAMP-binding protein